MNWLCETFTVLLATFHGTCDVWLVLSERSSLYISAFEIVNFTCASISHILDDSCKIDHRLLKKQPTIIYI